MHNLFFVFFDVLLTVHLSIFISVFNQLDAQFILCIFWRFADRASQYIYLSN